MALEVACVGSAMRAPPQPNFAARISAAEKAASVFPSPVGASMMISPGRDISRAIRMAARWAGRISAFSGKSNRSSKSRMSLSGGTGCHGSGRLSSTSARLARCSGVRSVTYGKKSAFDAIQSQTITNAVRTSWLGWSSPSVASQRSSSSLNPDVLSAASSRASLVSIQIWSGPASLLRISPWPWEG